MKRTFTFLMSLFLTIGAMWAQTEATRMTADQLNAVTEKQAIAIECTQITNYNRYYNGQGHTAELSNDIIYYWVPVADEAGAFYIMKGDGEEDYLQSNNITTFGTKEGAAKLHAVKPFVGGSGAENFSGADCYYNKTEEEMATWVRLAFLDNSKWFNFNGNQYNGGTGVWTVLYVHDMTGVDYSPATVTYNFMFEGTQIATQTTTTVVGAAYPDYTVVLPYGVVAANPEGTVAADATIEVELTVEKALPFEAAESVEGITKWYFVKMHTNTPKYIQALEDGTIEWADAEVAEGEEESHLWGFVGDIWGMKMVSKTGKAVVSTSGDALLGDAAQANAFVVAVCRSSEDAFCLQYADKDYLNGQSSAVKSWWDNDAGSGFLVEEYSSPTDEPSFDTEIVGVTPVEGEVTELKEIIVQFSNDKILPYSNVYVMDAKENVYEFVLDATHPDYTQAKYVSVNAITAAGTYILDCSQIDHMDTTTGQAINPFTGTFTWTIKESAPTFDTEIVGVTPVEGEVTELKEIIVQFSNDKVLPYSNIYVMDEKENVYEFVLDANHPDYTQAKYVSMNAITAAGTYILDCSQIDHMDMTTGQAIKPFTGTFTWTIKVVEDGIDNLNANAKAVIYDIHGRRVEKMEKGIYIVNGKKVIKK